MALWCQKHYCFITDLLALAFEGLDVKEEAVSEVGEQTF